MSKAHRYEPDINPSYRDLAEHYGVAVVPARARKPRDKAKAEVGVQVVERWILAVQRNRSLVKVAALLEALKMLTLGSRVWSRTTSLCGFDDLATVTVLNPNRTPANPSQTKESRHLLVWQMHPSAA